MSIKNIEKDFYRFVKKMQNYNEAITLMQWDLRTGAPSKGIEQRSETIGQLSEDVYKMSISDDMKAYIEALNEESIQSELSEMTKKLVEECKKEYDLNTKVPVNEYRDYVILQSKAENVWVEAKATSDFSLFQPYLEKLVETKKRFIQYWGEKETPYDTLLDQFEPGLGVKTIDRVFTQLREAIVPLVKEVAESSYQPKTSFLFNSFTKEKQRDVSMEILKQLGYDFSAGRLDETEHPFEITINRNDVRITTHYDEMDFRTAVFGTIHECGHAIYEQNISHDLIGTPLCSGTTMGIHESQSLFFENFIGRTRSFWHANYDLLKNYSSGQFRDVTLDDFYRAINVAGPSLIRIEADELTYPLHIMVRYEIEKGIFNGDFEVKDLPEIWNSKMQEYLGVVPEDDAKGVLQDIHWAGGDFGYFPSYALGYIYAAQFKHAMLKEIPNFDELLAEGNIQPIREWLTKYIHQYGKMKKPMEIIKDTTGKNLNAQYLIDYLTNKYRDVYRLS